MTRPRLTASFPPSSSAGEDAEFRAARRALRTARPPPHTPFQNAAVQTTLLFRARTAAEVRRAFSAGLPRRHRLPQPSQREPCSLHAQPRQVHLRRHRLRSPPRAPLRRPLHRLSPTNEVYRTNGQYLYSETMVIVKPLAKAIWPSTRARLRRAPAPPSLHSPAGSRMARAAARRRSARNVRAPRAPARGRPDGRPQSQTRPVRAHSPPRPRITRSQPPPPAPRTPVGALPHKAS